MHAVARPGLTIDSSGCRSSGSVAVAQAPVAVSVLLAPVAPVGVDASVDTDDYQKRSPVENVLESTENSRVIVSNRVHGKHSIRW